MNPEATNLLDIAHNLALRELDWFDNEITTDHSAVIRRILSTFIEIAQGHRMGRWAFPVGTGMGKSTAIRAFIRASIAGSGAEMFPILVPAVSDFS